MEDDDQFDDESPGESGLNDYHPYWCAFCGEENEVFIDGAAFAHSSTQRFTEDCAVCCRPNLITVRSERDGSVSMDVTREYDA